MITGKTKIMGLIGDPVEHTISPFMHNAGFKYFDLDYAYVPFHVARENLKFAIEGARALDIKGLNVTIPHKIEVMKYLDVIHETAWLIGAVNTIRFADEVEGYNTDGLGAIRGIKELTPLKGRKVIILGAGGASRAISFQSVLSGAGQVVIANRTLEKALKLALNLKDNLNVDVKAVSLGEELEKELEDADILINTTPIGMYPNVDDKPLVTSDMMHEGLVVNDVIYNPLETGLLREARLAGAKTITGIKMLIYQGIESFKIWTGREPPLKVFEEALEDEIKKL
ncbi:MAG: Shikimate dehydrogenase [Methanobacterium sp. PtaU1.Bin097]|jgi:shikimate dehydrogenase|nr:MAG: Shikimate dehydrogenase [Methanobacterium sp. PtaU1.Bin097]